MSKKSDLSRLGFDATNMCIMQIGETLNKLSSDIQKNYPKLPIKEELQKIINKLQK